MSLRDNPVSVKRMHGVLDHERRDRRLRARILRGAAAGSDVAVPDQVDTARRMASRRCDRCGYRDRRRACTLPPDAGGAALAAHDPSAAPRPRTCRCHCARRGSEYERCTAHFACASAAKSPAEIASPWRAFLTALGGTASNPSTIVSWGGDLRRSEHGRSRAYDCFGDPPRCGRRDRQPHRGSRCSQPVSRLRAGR